MSRAYRFVLLDESMQEISEVALVCLNDEDALVVASHVGPRNDVQVWEHDRYVGVFRTAFPHPAARPAVQPAPVAQPAPAPIVAPAPQPSAPQPAPPLVFTVAKPSPVPPAVVPVAEPDPLPVVAAPQPAPVIEPEPVAVAQPEPEPEPKYDPSRPYNPFRRGAWRRRTP